MESGWYVYKEGQKMGPYTPADIRVLLRNGELDPFDIVSKVGSNIQIELVEVDDIFDLANQERNPEPNEPQQEFKRNESTTVRMEPGASKKITNEFAQLLRESGFEESPGDYDDAAHAFKSQKKNYFLVEKGGRILGPLSAKDILHMYFNDKIGSSAKVQKQGYAKKIDINRFMAVYSNVAPELENSKLREKSKARSKGTPAGNQFASSRAMEERARALRLENFLGVRKIPILGTSGALVALVAGYFVVVGLVHNDIFARFFRNSWEGSRTERPSRKDQQSKSHHSGAEVRESVESTIRNDQVENSGAVREEKSAISQAIANSSPEGMARRKSTKRAKVKRGSKTKSNDPMELQQFPSSYRPPPPRSQGTRNTYANSISTPPPRQSVSPATLAARPPIPAVNTDANNPALVASLQRQLGALATIGPLTYKIGDLKRCGLKCNLVFRDQVGKALVAVFFTDAFADVLNRRAGRATIKGTVSKQNSVIVMFLKEVL